MRRGVGHSSSFLRFFLPSFPSSLSSQGKAASVSPGGVVLWIPETPPGPRHRRCEESRTKSWGKCTVYFLSPTCGTDFREGPKPCSLLEGPYPRTETSSILDVYLDKGCDILTALVVREGQKETSGLPLSLPYFHWCDLGLRDKGRHRSVTRGVILRHRRQVQV